VRITNACGCLWLMVWTAPYGIECARMSLSKVSDEGAVREAGYPNWHGYVEAYFSAAWGDADEQPVLRKRLRRKEMVLFFAKLPPM
jgi:hypothetical protein